MTAIGKIRAMLSAYPGVSYFGLSSACRLRIVYRGNAPVNWTVEYVDGQQWIRESQMGLLLQPFWRSARAEYRQNRLLEEPGESAPGCRVDHASRD